MINRSAARAMQQTASMFQQAAAAGKQVAKGAVKLVSDELSDEGADTAAGLVDKAGQGAAKMAEAGGQLANKLGAAANKLGEKAAHTAAAGMKDPAGFAGNLATGVAKGGQKFAGNVAKGVVQGAHGVATNTANAAAKGAQWGVGVGTNAVGLGMKTAEKAAEIVNPVGAVTQAVETIYKVGMFGASKAGQAAAVAGGAAQAGQQAGANAAGWAAGQAAQGAAVIEGAANAWGSAASDAAAQAFGAFSAPFPFGGGASGGGTGSGPGSGASPTGGPDTSNWTTEALSAAADAIGLWKLQLKITNSKIMAVTLMVSPGGFRSSFNIRTSMRASLVAAGLPESAANAYGKTVHDLWEAWEDGLQIAGYPAYPTFAAWPGPQAPPTPCVPIPLIACPSGAVSGLINSTTIKDRLAQNLESATNLGGGDRNMLGDAFGTAFAAAFTVWLASSKLMLVLGKGPVPSFAPPYVPVGPVVMGDVIANPGILASAPEFGNGMF